ncbi:serine/threonine protein kinase [Acaryochloris sp. 'Moss Beach']|nr:serine/threonine protein kinase [Acaryochloris sp. 'Moss Beach']
MFEYLPHQAGDLIAERFCLISVLGQGGSAITYTAKDLDTHQLVAIKQMSLMGMENWKQLELFEREAKVLSQLDHPAIPNYIDYCQTDTAGDQYFYIIQELAPGKSLAKWIDQGWQASPDEVKKIALQVLDILNYIHASTPPIIHRDIKPQNIIRNDDGQVYLVDFGAVQNVYHNSMMGSTFVGTYGYMAPEHFLGKAVPATDLYSLGATLLFLLTHCSPVDLPRNGLKIGFRSVIKLEPAFANWLTLMLEPALEDRFSSAQDAISVLFPIKVIRRPSRAGVEPQRIYQPPGSRIQLHKTSTSVTVHMPPFDWNWEAIARKCLKLWFNLLILLCLLAGVELMMSPLILGIVSIIGGMVWTGMLTSTVFSITGHTHLEIDSKSFRVIWQIKHPSVKHVRKGFTADLIAITWPTTSRGKAKYCMLVTKDYQYNFGMQLTPTERAWLVEEIGAFLNLQQQ